MTHINPNIDDGDRLLDLLADEQTIGLSADDRIELEDLISGATMADREREAFEHAAASAAIALADGAHDEELPADLRDRLYASIGKPAAQPAPPAIALEPKPTEHEAELAIRRNIAFHYAGWFAAAACFIIAVVASWPAPSGADAVLEQKIAAVEAAPDTVTLTWADWNNPDLGGDAEIQGVTGKAVWSDQANTGYMVFNGLPKLDDAVYQLWIIDAERGMAQRISGGVFNGAGDDGELRVAIADTPIPVTSAAAFAITIEEPGGTWVSDMTRRVVIAARG